MSPLQINPLAESFWLLPHRRLWELRYLWLAAKGFRPFRTRLRHRPLKRPLTHRKNSSSRAATHIQRRQGHPGCDAAGRNRGRLHLSEWLRRLAGLFHSESSRNDCLAGRLRFLPSWLSRFCTSRELPASPSSLKGRSRFKIFDQGLQGQGFRRGGFEGFPRFEKCIFKGEYPFGEAQFSDSVHSARGDAHGWNPFIPLDDKNSGIPCVILEYTLRNASPRTVEYEFSYHLSHLAPGCSRMNRQAAIP